MGARHGREAVWIRELDEENWEKVVAVTAEDDGDWRRRSRGRNGLEGSELRRLEEAIGALRSGQAAAAVGMGFRGEEERWGQR